MKVFFDKKNDFLEVIDCDQTVFADMADKSLDLFFSEDNEELVGFALRNASSNIKLLAHVPVRMRLAGLVRILRSKDGLTQEGLAKKTGISFRHIQRVESGEIALTLDMLSKIADAFPLWDLSILVSPRTDAESA